MSIRSIGDPDTALEETMRALDDIVRTGKARHVGVSNFRLAQIETCMRQRRVDVVQYGWNMFDRRMQAEIFPTARPSRSAYGLRIAGHHPSGTFRRHKFEESWPLAGGMPGNLRSAPCSGQAFPQPGSRQGFRLASKYDKTLLQFGGGRSATRRSTALVGFRAGRGDEPGRLGLDHLRPDRWISIPRSAA
jgi:hypothetical protein